MKVAIIGCGGIAPAHIHAYKSMKNIEEVALCDLNIDRARNLAAKFRIKETFGNYWDMLDKQKFDLVDVCTPVSTHAKIVCDIAKTSPAILVEKPMAMNVSECEKMITAVTKSNSKLCIGHSQIFSPNIQRAKALIDSGKFVLLSFNTTQKESFELLRAHNLAPDWNVAPTQKGIIWEVCCHLAYLQLHFLPDIKEVYAVGGKVKYPVYDDFAVVLHAGDQRFGLIELSWLSKETEIIYELRDNTGKCIHMERDFDYFLEKDARPPLSFRDAVRDFLVDEKRILQKWGKFGKSYFLRRRLLPTFNLIGNYIESIEKDLPPPVSPEDGKKTINLLECIEKSLDEKQPVAMSR